MKNDIKNFRFTFRRELHDDGRLNLKRMYTCVTRVYRSIPLADWGPSKAKSLDQVYEGLMYARWDIHERKLNSVFTHSEVKPKLCHRLQIGHLVKRPILSIEAATCTRCRIYIDLKPHIA